MQCFSPSLHSVAALHIASNGVCNSRIHSHACNNLTYCGASILALPRFGMRGYSASPLGVCLSRYPVILLSSVLGILQSLLSPGAGYGYLLVWVVVLANAMAMCSTWRRVDHEASPLSPLPGAALRRSAARFARRRFRDRRPPAPERVDERTAPCGPNQRAAPLITSFLAISPPVPDAGRPAPLTAVGGGVTNGRNGLGSAPSPRLGVGRRGVGEPPRRP